MLKEPPI